MKNTVSVTTNKPEVSIVPFQEGSVLVGVEDYAQDANIGLEQIGADERAVPFLRILQRNSPQCDDNSDVPGARPGMIFNTATQEVYSGQTGLLFVPAFRDHNYVEFIPRINGGGFVGLWDASDSEILRLRQKHGSFGKLTNENGNELVETYYLYGLMIPPGKGPDDPPSPPAPCVVPFASTQIKKYRAIMARLSTMFIDPIKLPGKVYPIFAHVLRVGTVQESNKHGTFYGWRIGLASESAELCRIRPDSMLYIEAKKLAHELKEGKLRAAFEGESVVTQNYGDDDIPL